MKTLFTVSLVIALFFILPFIGEAATVKLSWDSYADNHDSDTDNDCTFQAYVATESGAYNLEEQPFWQGSTELTDIYVLPQTGIDFWFAVRAFRTNSPDEISALSVEVFYSLEHTIDTDEDGLTDWDENNIYGTNPNLSDHDDDGLSDGEEVDKWASLWNSSWDSDNDGDGIINILDPDSDNDGHTDGEEHDKGSDPGDAGDTPTPEQVTGVYYEDGTLYWDPLTGVTLYNIHFGDSPDNLLNTHTVYFGNSQAMSLPLGYFMAVSGVNSEGEEGPNSLAVTNSLPLSVVTGLTFVDGELTWDAMDGVYEYAVYISQDAENITGEDVISVYTNSTDFNYVPPGYFFAVAAVSGSEEGPLSDIVSSDPPAPDIPQVTGLDLDGYTLSWDPLELEDLTGYKVYYSQDPENVTANFSVVYTTEITFMGIPPGYYFAVAGLVDDYEGPLSEVVNNLPPPLPVVTGVTYENGVLSWDPIPGITEFDIHFRVGDIVGNYSFFYTVYNANALPIGAPSSYHFKVAAVDELGTTGPFSDPTP